ASAIRDLAVDISSYSADEELRVKVVRAKITIEPICGDGIVAAPEQCDGGPCCTSTCRFANPGTSCTDDGNICTDDVCNAIGTCAQQPNAAPCNDGQFCNGTDTCGGGTCSQHAGNPCPGQDVGPACNDSCDEVHHSCTAPDHAGVTCDDGHFCTAHDTCNGSG